MYQFKLHTPRGFTNILLVYTIITSALSAQTPAPSDIYVGRGYFGGEYYDFFTDQARTNQVNISDYIFYKGSTYTFHKILGSGHPFYLSDTPLSSGSYHRGTLTLPVTSSANPNRTSGIVPGESMSVTIPVTYSEQLHYYCTILYHSSMVASLNVGDPPTYINSTRLIITEVDRAVNYIEVTNFGDDSGELEADTTITNILGDSVTLPSGTSFSSGQTKEFSNSLPGSGHLQLIALDATNPDYWVVAQDDSNKGYFFDEQVIADPLPDVPQGEIAIGLQTVASGLSHLIGLADPNDGTGRLFLVEQEGRVKVLNSDGSISQSDFMDVSANLVSLVLDSDGYDERGLLGLALSPSFAGDGTLFFYASYSKGDATPDFTVSPDTLIMDGTGYDDIDHHSVIIKRTITDDNLDGIFDFSDSYVDTEILRFEQPTTNTFASYGLGSNHNGGHLFFDADGLLMVAIGDGGDANDTGNGHVAIGNGADATNILGTLIRIDPDGSNSANGKYGIPADNPFVGHPTYLPEIYAYGFRNPWTFSQDPTTGEIFSSDSGQNFVQEVNRVLPGKNYGWRAKEGSFLFDPVTGTIGSLYSAPTIYGLEDPIVEYDHGQGYANIIGGHIYRGSLIPELQGAYVCGDYGPIFSGPGDLFYVEGLNDTPLMKRFQIGVTDRALLTDIRAFSVDGAGEVYFVANSNDQSSLYKIVPLAHLEINATDEVELTVTGDEGSQITLEKSSDLDFTNSQDTTVNGGKLIQTYPLEDQAFFRVIAE
jgi:glucose/arabinose dehydrogenase